METGRITINGSVATHYINICTTYQLVSPGHYISLSLHKFRRWSNHYIFLYERSPCLCFWRPNFLGVVRVPSEGNKFTTSLLCGNPSIFRNPLFLSRTRPLGIAMYLRQRPVSMITLHFGSLRMTSSQMSTWSLPRNSDNFFRTLLSLSSTKV